MSIEFRCISSVFSGLICEGDVDCGIIYFWSLIHLCSHLYFINLSIFCYMRNMVLKGVISPRL